METSKKFYQVTHYPDIDYWKIIPTIDSSELNIYKWHKNSHIIILQEPTPEKALAKARKIFSKVDTTGKYFYTVVFKDDLYNSYYSTSAAKSDKNLNKVYYDKGRFLYEYGESPEYISARYEVQVQGDSQSDCEERGRKLIDDFKKHNDMYGE